MRRNAKEVKASQSDANFGEVCIALRGFHSGPQRKKNGGSDEDTTRSADQKKTNGWMEAPKRWKKPKGEDRTGMKKEARRLRCTLLDGSAWSTEKSI